MPPVRAPAAAGVLRVRGIVEPEAPVAGANLPVDDRALVLDQPGRFEPDDVDQEVGRGADVRVRQASMNSDAADRDPEATRDPSLVTPVEFCCCRSGRVAIVAGVLEQREGSTDAVGA